MVHTLLDRPSPAHPTSPADPDLVRRRRFDHARSVLEQARVLIERGWLQHGWYRTGRPQPRSLLARWRQAERPPGIDDVRQACLVAAVTVAAHGGRVHPDPGLALDLVWDALWETRGQLGPAAAGRVPAPEVRVARTRELVRWNDAADRTRDDVLALLDRAIGRGIMAAVGAPADQRAATASPSR